MYPTFIFLGNFHVDRHPCQSTVLQKPSGCDSTCNEPIRCRVVPWPCPSLWRSGHWSHQVGSLSGHKYNRGFFSWCCDGTINNLAWPKTTLPHMFVTVQFCFFSGDSFPSSKESWKAWSFHIYRWWFFKKCDSLYHRSLVSHLHSHQPLRCRHCYWLV